MLHRCRPGVRLAIALAPTAVITLNDVFSYIDWPSVIAMILSNFGLAVCSRTCAPALCLDDGALRPRVKRRVPTQASYLAAGC